MLPVRLEMTVLVRFVEISLRASTRQMDMKSSLTPLSLIIYSGSLIALPSFQNPSMHLYA